MNDKVERLVRIPRHVSSHTNLAAMRDAEIAARIREDLRIYLWRTRYMPRNTETLHGLQLPPKNWVPPEWEADKE